MWLKSIFEIVIWFHIVSPICCSGFVGLTIFREEGLFWCNVAFGTNSFTIEIKMITDLTWYAILSKFSKTLFASKLFNPYSPFILSSCDSKRVHIIKGSFLYHIPVQPGPNTSSMPLTLFVDFTFIFETPAVLYFSVNEFSVRSLTIKFRVQHSIDKPRKILGSNRSIKEFSISTHWFHALVVQFGESLSHR